MFDSHTVETKKITYYTGQTILNEEAVDAGHHLSIASLHVSKCNFWVDRMATGHAENLQVGVFIAFVYLQMHTE